VACARHCRNKITLTKSCAPLAIPFSFHQIDSATLLLALEVVQQNASLLALLAPVLDDDAGAVDDLASIALTIQDAQAGPFAELLSIGNLDQRDLVLGAQRNNELLVGFFFAGFVEDAHVRLTTIESLGGFAQAAGKTIVDEGDLEDTCRRACLASEFVV
jgi:hypothetical protein